MNKMIENLLIFLSYDFWISNRIGARRIYCLMRPKKNLSPAERVKKMCTGPVSFKYLNVQSVSDVYKI